MVVEAIVYHLMIKFFLFFFCIFYITWIIILFGVSHASRSVTTTFEASVPHKIFYFSNIFLYIHIVCFLFFIDILKTSLKAKSQII